LLERLADNMAKKENINNLQVNLGGDDEDNVFIEEEDDESVD